MAGIELVVVEKGESHGQGWGQGVETDLGGAEQGAADPVTGLVSGLS